MDQLLSQKTKTGAMPSPAGKPGTKAMLQLAIGVLAGHTLVDRELNREYIRNIWNIYILK